MIHPELAQNTIDRLMVGIEQSMDPINEAFTGALADLVIGLQIDRGLIWQVAVSELMVTHEYSANGSPRMLKTSINSMESTQLVLGFLSEHTDKSDRLVEIQDGKPSRGELGDWAPFSKFCDDYQATILMPMRAHGILPGFFSFQSKSPKAWSSDERLAILRVGQLIATIVSYEFEIARLKGVSPKTLPSGPA
jgi:hypothetical protein